MKINLGKYVFEINRFLKDTNSEKDRYQSYQKRFVKFNIHRNSKVLDIGSGWYPFLQATVFADIDSKESELREAGLLKGGRRFVRCSVEKTPFKNKEFDFVYCSHVLEHTADPARACE